ncbi:MAG: response regulator [Marinilabiliaceae bacterium]|nr:response regulator [Marinilabiliaceae bacterium]
MARLSIILILITNILAVKAQDRFWDKNVLTTLTMSDGLQHNFVDDLYEDNKGFLWIATNGGGLSRYDGYNFQYYDISTEPHLRSNFLHKIAADNHNRLWIASDDGIDIIDLTTMRNVTDEIWPSDMQDKILHESRFVETDRYGNIWFMEQKNIVAVEIDNNGYITNIYSRSFENEVSALQLTGNILRIAVQSDLYTASIDNGNILLNKESIAALENANTTITSLFAKDNELWIGTIDGLHRINTNSGVSKFYSQSTQGRTRLTQNRITDIGLTTQNEVIVATLKGLNIYNAFDDSFEQITNETGSSKHSLTDNFINCMLLSRGTLYIGTEACGVNIISPNDISVRNFTHSNSPTSIAPNPVNAIIEDARQNLWVGNVEGGLNRKPKNSDSFDHYTSQNIGLTHNSISALTIDGKGHLWAGTWGGGINEIDINGAQPVVLHKYVNMKNPFIGSITYDPINDAIWAASVHNIYVIKDGVISKPINSAQLEGMNGALGSAIDNKNRLWLGTNKGIVIIDLESYTTDSVKYCVHDSSSSNNLASLVFPRVTCITHTQNGNTYIGTNGYGFCTITERNGEILMNIFSTRNGLANNSVRGIVEDENGTIWISTNRGLSLFDPYSNSFINYTTENGMATDSYYWNASYKSAATGYIYFGALDGLTEIQSHRIHINSEKPQAPVFTQLTVYNEEIAANSSYIQNDIVYADHIEMHERDKSFTISFSGLELKNSASMHYKYRLLGYDEQWIDADNRQHSATYTNIANGSYTFEVVQTNGSGIQSDISRIKIDIEPYFYKTIWFYITVILIITSGIILYTQVHTRSLREQKRILEKLVGNRTAELNEQARQLEEKAIELKRQNEQLNEQNAMILKQNNDLESMSTKVQKLTSDRLSFFTNISHEIRTPISLILGPIDHIIKATTDKSTIEQLEIVKRNANYMLDLVNQLLDFRKVESGEMELHPKSGRLRPFMEDIIHPFSIYASERNINIKVNYEMTDDVIVFDSDAMSKIMTNIISNAIKFCYDSGIIDIIIAQTQSEKGEMLQVSISDTGRKIPEDQLESIFIRFHQADNHPKNMIPGQSGTGIGLYLCKQLVEQQGGTISARNNDSDGVTFTFCLPLIRPQDVAVANADNEISEIAEDEEDEDVKISDKRMAILVVEDNNDMRLYVRSVLSDKYLVYEARDGMDGLTQLAEHDIDFIIADLMMPVMDGLEFSKRVKQNFSFSHIPILILTANPDDNLRTEGYKIGVESYLNKPFDEQMLMARIAGILEGRKMNQHRFQATLNTDDLNLDSETNDDKFIRNVIEHVKEHFSDPDYAIEDILKDLSCSKSMLNKKMQSMVGQSPGVFIRCFRLNAAKQLILKNREKKRLNISQIAYEVGFNDPKYFTRCFTKHFNMTPSALQNTEIDEQQG